MISLMVSETSTHSQVYYCHRNSKSQLDTDSNTSSQLATTLLATLNILEYFNFTIHVNFSSPFEILGPFLWQNLKLKFNFIYRKLKGVSELSSKFGHNSKFNRRQI